MRLAKKICCAIVLSAACLAFVSQGSVFAQNSPDVKSEIYSKLKCCNCNVSFGECSCPEAKEMKAYIEALLESGVSGDDIFYKIAKKFSLETIQDEKIKIQVQESLLREAGEKRAQIALSPESFDFGKAAKKQGKVIKIFRLSNKGNADLIISNIRVSCSCVTASLKTKKYKSPNFGMAGALDKWQQRLGSGETADLEVVLDLAHNSMIPGKHKRAIFVSSNDPVYPELTLKVEVEVTE